MGGKWPYSYCFECLSWEYILYIFLSVDQHYMFYGSWSNHHLAAISSILRSFKFQSSDVSSCHHLSSYSLSFVRVPSCSKFFPGEMRNESGTTISCVHITFISLDTTILNGPTKRGISEQDKAFLYLRTAIHRKLTKSFLTLELFCSSDWHHPLIAVVLWDLEFSVCQSHRLTHCIFPRFY